MLKIMYKQRRQLLRVCLTKVIISKVQQMDWTAKQAGSPTNDTHHNTHTHICIYIYACICTYIYAYMYVPSLALQFVRTIRVVEYTGVDRAIVANGCQLLLLLHASHTLTQILLHKYTNTHTLTCKTSKSSKVYRAVCLGLGRDNDRRDRAVCPSFLHSLNLYL